MTGKLSLSPSSFFFFFFFFFFVLLSSFLSEHLFLHCALPFLSHVSEAFLCVSLRFNPLIITLISPMVSCFL
jgi:hypothetical protein